MITDNKKPHADDTGYLNILGSTEQASNDIVANDDFLSHLIHIGQGENSG